MYIDTLAPCSLQEVRLIIARFDYQRPLRIELTKLPSLWKQTVDLFFWGLSIKVRYLSIP